MYLFELVCKEAGLTEDDWNGEDFITVEGMTKLRDLFISKGDLELGWTIHQVIKQVVKEKGVKL